jgi:hypothetical protein
MKIACLIVLGIIFLMFYVSVLTGFFAVYLWRGFNASPDLRSALCRGYKGIKPESNTTREQHAPGLCPEVVDYYDSKNKKIKMIDTDEGYFSHILHIAGIFFINIFVTLFYNNIIGMIIYGILILLGIIVMFLIKRNMKNITEIICVDIRCPATVKFKSKLLTILLSPFSNTVFIIICLILLAGFIFTIK